MRILRFLAFLLFPMRYLHQAYVWDNDIPRGTLSVEFFAGGKNRDYAYGRSWVHALWMAAK